MHTEDNIPLDDAGEAEQGLLVNDQGTKTLASDKEQYTSFSDTESGGEYSSIETRSWGVTFNTMNVIVGAGVLSMPFCFQTAGWLLGVVILLLTALLTDWSLQLLLLSGDLRGKRSYPNLIGDVLGPTPAFIANILITFLNFGTSIAYLDIIADQLSSWFGIQSRGWALLVVVLFIITPLCMIKNISSLSFTSAMGIGVYSSVSPLFSLLVRRTVH